MGEELRSIRTLLPLLRQSRFGITTFIVLGLVGSAFEGLGLFLFVPLLHLLGDRSGSLPDIPEWMIPLTEFIPVDYRIPVVAAAIVGSIAIKNVVIYINRLLFAVVDADAGFRLRQDLYEAILSASPAFLDTQPTGRVANALFSESWRAQRGLAIVFSSLIDIGAILIFATVLVLISWQMTLIMLPLLALIAFVLHLLTRRAKRLGHRAVEANAVFAMRAWEGLTGLATVRAFGQERHEAERFAQTSKTVRDLLLRLQSLNDATMPIFEVLLATLLAAFIVALSYTSVLLPTLATFLIVLYRLQPRVHSLVSARVNLLELGPALAEVNEVIFGATASRLPSGSQSFRTFQTRITFDQVSFSYAGSEQTSLADLTVEIPQGRTTAVVGQSGAGKSTFIQLLCRNLDPTSGSVEVDGIPLPALDLASWRAKIAVVAQDVHLFSDTVRNNIAYGRPGVSDMEVEAAARLANADEFIRMLPQGYDTEVGDRGTRLSGGQRQRIAFARALVRKPEILILDEATNALDSHAESLIQDALALVGRQSTIVVIAHRLATIRNADQILVLENGRLVERGNMAELLARNGPFTAMYRLQIAGLSSERGPGNGGLRLASGSANS